MKTKSIKINATHIPTLVIAAGLATSAIAQMGTQPGTTNQNDRERLTQQRNADDQPDRKAHRKQLRVSDMRFVEFETLEGADIVNANNETVGTVNDLVIDRGSGEISDVVIQFNDFLGFGGNKVAVPFESLRFDRDEGEVGMDVTQEQLDQLGEFTPPEWDDVDSSDSDEQWYLFSEKRSGNKHADPYALSGDQSPETETISGTIGNVVRFNTADDVEFVSINIMPKGDGEMTRVILGPSWHVMAKDNAPMEGDTAEVTAYALSNDTLDRMVATEATIDGEMMRLRDGSNRAAWTSRDSNASSPPRLMLMSKLIGTDIAARDRDAGEISCAFVETKSGKVTLLGIDPNENLLGINDREVLVPLSRVSIGADIARIDASPDELADAQELPDEASQLASRSMMTKIYEPFGSEPAVLREREQRSWNWDRSATSSMVDRRENDTARYERSGG